MAETMQEEIRLILKSIVDNSGLIKFGKNLKELTEKQIRHFDRSLKETSKSMKSLLMPMLGVMFFGMAMKSMFSSLLQPVMDAYGVFDLFSTMLLVVFLPIMDAIFPYLLDFMDFFMNLPDSVKLSIGIIAVLGVILGTILMIVGQLAIAFIAVSAALEFITVSSILTFFVYLAAILAIVFLFVDGFKRINENFGDSWGDVALGIGEVIVAIGLLYLTFGPLIAGIGAVISAFYLMYKISSWGLKQQGLEYKSFGDAIVGTIIDAVVGIILIFWAIPTALVEVFKSMIKMAIYFGAGLVDAIIAGINGKDMSDAFGKQLSAGFSSVKQDWLNNFMIPAGTLASTTTTFKQALGLVKPIEPVTNPTDNLANSIAAARADLNSTNLTQNVTNNVQVMDKNEFQRMLDENNKKMMEQMRTLARG